MTTPDDGQRDDAGNGTPDGRIEPEPPFDEEAAWRSIVENYGERASLGPLTVDPVPLEPPPSTPPPIVPRADPRPGPGSDHRLDRAPEDPGDQHEHFVPPVPPPVPRATPARRLAWIGLFGPPIVMILAVALGWTFPSILSFALVAAFVGGFVFLVATMPRDREDGGDDGAVV